MANVTTYFRDMDFVAATRALEFNLFTFTSTPVDDEYYFRPYFVSDHAPCVFVHCDATTEGMESVFHCEALIPHEGGLFYNPLRARINAVNCLMKDISFRLPTMTADQVEAVFAAVSTV